MTVNKGGHPTYPKWRGPQYSEGLVGLYEIAKRCGVGIHTPAVWLHRGKIPPPIARIGRRGRAGAGTPVWYWKTIESALARQYYEVPTEPEPDGVPTSAQSEPEGYVSPLGLYVVRSATDELSRPPVAVQPVGGCPHPLALRRQGRCMGCRVIVIGQAP